MRYIKALIKTIKQMDRFNRNMSLGFLSLIFGMILSIPCRIFESYIILIPTLIFIVVGMYLVSKTLWEESLRDDLVKFINKIKSNLD